MRRGQRSRLLTLVNRNQFTDWQADIAHNERLKELGRNTKECSGSSGRTPSHSLELCTSEPGDILTRDRPRDETILFKIMVESP